MELLTSGSRQLLPGLSPHVGRPRRRPSDALGAGPRRPPGARRKSADLLYYCTDDQKLQVLGLCLDAGTEAATTTGFGVKYEPSRKQEKVAGSKINTARRLRGSGFMLSLRIFNAAGTGL